MFLPKRLFSLLLALILLWGVFPVFAFAEEEPSVLYGIGFVTLPNQRLYSEPSASSQVLKSTSDNDVVIILEKERNSWYKVIHDLQEGYMYADCLDVSTEIHAELGMGRVKDDIVYLRSGPGTEYSILNSAYEDKEFYIIGMFDGWFKILHQKKRSNVIATGFIRSDLLELTEYPAQNASSDTEPKYFCLGKEISEIDYEETKKVAMAAPGSYFVPISGNYLLAQAQNYIGVPYVYGGYSPDGFDCSGLIYYILSKTGYVCPRTAAGQYSIGRSVSRDSLQAGDLVFFANTAGSGITHVGIYAGGNKFIHAPNEGGSVCYSSLSGYWASHFHGARRIG